MSVSLAEILALSVEERLELVQQIWDSIATELDGLPLTEAQRREIDRRLEAYERDPSQVSTWEEVRARIVRGR
jgi:putative addiction module component (TIGR02574 family)